MAKPQGAGFTPARAAASDVLRELIDARLLTSYEVREDEHEPIRRAEIIHESLLANWPRLVRWQTQDQEGAQLRGELRQAAKTWDEHDRTDDLLWTGTAYREFRLWSERYPGGLTELEEAFGAAMTEFATRRKRRRRIAVTTLLVVALVVTAVTLTLWRRSVRNELRAQAQQLLALGKAALEGYPTAALAFATRSLEISESEESRLLALEALWQGPTAIVVNDNPTLGVSFSPDGKWLAQTHDLASKLAVISSDGHQTILNHPSETGTPRVSARFGGRSDVFLSWGGISDEGHIALWSSVEARMLATDRPMTEPTEFSIRAGGIGRTDDQRRAIFAMATDELATVDALYPDGTTENLGTIPLQPLLKEELCLPRDSPDWVGIVDGNYVSVVRITQSGLSERLPLGRHEGDLYGYCAAEPLGEHLLTASRSGGCRIWDPTGVRNPLDLNSPPGFTVIPSDDWSMLIGTGRSSQPKLRDVLIWSFSADEFTLIRRIDAVKINGGCSIDPVGMGLATRGPMPAHRLWSLAAPAAADPTLLRKGAAGLGYTPRFSPDGRWVATSDQSGLTLWPQLGPRAAVIRLPIENWMGGVAFDPAGGFLVVAADSAVTLLPLEGAIPAAEHTIFDVGRTLLTQAVISPSGELFAVGRHGGEVWIGRDDGETPRLLFESEVPGSSTVGFSKDGRFLAALTGFYGIKSAVYRVWDVESGEQVAVFDIGEESFRNYGAGFDSRGRLLTSSSKGVLAWDIETGDYEVLVEADVANFAASADGRRLVATYEGGGGFAQDPAGPPIFIDLESGTRTVLESHGSRVKNMAMNAEGTIVVTGDAEGVVRVGLTTGEEPHVLFGHEGWAYKVAIDPKGRWIASGGQDHTIRLWPMPDLSKPPIHTLPREQLIAKLKTLTNLRVVRDPDSSTGWTLTHDPFPGWETVPTW